MSWFDTRTGTAYVAGSMRRSVGSEQMGTNPSSPYNLTLGLIGQFKPRITVDVTAGFLEDYVL